MNRRTGLWLLAGALFLASCAIVRSDFRTAVVASLQNYATLLREMNRHGEAAETEARAEKLRLASQNPYPASLGFDPAQTLKDYAAVLTSQTEEIEAKEVEALADAYQRVNVAHFQRPAFQRSLEEKHLGDRLIVPGERIGQVRLGSEVEEIFRALGKGFPRGQGFREGTTIYTWDPIGLWLIADDITGEILWISVEGGPPANPHSWVELSTREGLRLGSAEEEVLAVMGKPSRTVSDGFAKSFYFDQQGIRFTLPITGPLAGKVAALRVVPPGAQP
ncbi:MAG: hypothetical protein HYV00_03030 [Deltaproteobacteria bacterium]|nr:hypothetical protein [Deltaproteobacteria bacterium]